AIFYFISSFSIRVFSGLGKSIVNSGTMPKVWGICLLLLALIILIRGLKGMQEARAAGNVDTIKFNLADFWKKNYPVIGTFIIVAVYILLLSSVGFIIMTMIYLFLQIIIMTHPQKRRYDITAVIAVIFSITTYFVFVKGLNIILPGGLLPL
ncbi:MAG: tripartite tricarboxylate transporter TctB family protein, partial [Clostridia bacterium]